MRNWINLVETYTQYTLMTASDLAREASGYMRGMGASGSPEAQKSEDEFDWRYEPSYPISNLNPETDKSEWMKEEIVMWAEDEGQPDRYDDELNNPIREPIIAIEINGVGEIIDGWHRVGASSLTGRTTIPAIVGILKR